MYKEPSNKQIKDIPCDELWLLLKKLVYHTAPQHAVDNILEVYDILQKKTLKEWYIQLPKELTAENGAKAYLVGEFGESIELYDPEEDDTYEKNIPIRWETIKAIYKKIVKRFHYWDTCATCEWKKYIEHPEFECWNCHWTGIKYL